MSQRRPKDRSHWGDEAFRAMHDKPITRKVLHKALQEPIARELLDTIDSNAAKYILASRVEAVLAYCQFVRESRSGVVVASKIERILDGEKP